MAHSTRSKKNSPKCAKLGRRVGLAAVEEEFGDLLFSLVNASRFLNVEPEQALRRAVAKFERRFRALEEAVHARSEEVSALSLAALDEIWDEVKAREKAEE